MPADLDQHSPEMDMPSAEPGPEMAQPAGDVIGAHGQTDREGAMAKADLYKLANYSHKLYQQINDEDQMEAWVQAKITKAADYIASVYHYLEYEMKFSEYGHHLDNSDTLSEGQRMKIKELLSEAKDKMKDLKKSQAEKMKGKKVEEGILSGGEQPCAECGGTGMIYREAQPVPDHVKAKAEKYKRLTKATHAAHKRLDKNHNGVPDDEELDELTAEYPGGSTDFNTGEVKTKEGFEAGEKVGSTKKTRTGVMTKTDTGVKHTNTSHSDEEHGEPTSKVKSRSAADKSGEKAMDKAADKDYKAAKKANPEGVRRYSLGKQVDEAKLKGKQTKLDVDHDGDIEADDLADLRAGKKEKKVSEQTMSRAAKGNEKYGKDGMKALAKAGREGKSLEPIKAKYNKYDEAIAPTKDMPKKGDKIGKEGNAFGKAVQDAKAAGDKTMKVGGKTMPVKEATSAGKKPCPPMSHIKKMCKDGKSYAEICKMHPDCDRAELKQMVSDCKKQTVKETSGYQATASAMWNNIKETQAYIAEKAKSAKPDFLDMDKDGDKKEPMKKAVADKKATVKESTELQRMQELTGRLNRTEKPALIENREVDQIRALTKRLLG